MNNSFSNLAMFRTSSCSHNETHHRIDDSLRTLDEEIDLYCIATMMHATYNKYNYILRQHYRWGRSSRTKNRLVLSYETGVTNHSQHQRGNKSIEALTNIRLLKSKRYTEMNL